MVITPMEMFMSRAQTICATGLKTSPRVSLIAGAHLSGWFAWWTWLFIHILYLAGFRNRLSVLFEWGYSFFTFQRGARLILGDRTGQKASI